MIEEKLSSLRNGNPLYQRYGSRRTLRWLVFIVLAALTTLYMTSHSYSPSPMTPKTASTGSASKGSILHNHSPHRHISKQKKAKLLLPAELMARPTSRDLQTIPRLIHQSWSSPELPVKMERWSATCRKQHPDWEWVLWTDEDNEELVKTHFPWLLKTYQELPGVIYQADMVRYLYMYMFGGVYADLDVECLRPFDEMFKEYNVTTVDHAKPRPVSTHTMQKNGRQIFYGRMGVDSGSHNSIPNAWMAATPGHPFNLLVVESAMKTLADAASKSDKMPGPEALTGPERLYSMIKEYLDEKSPWAGEKIDEHVAKVPAAKNFVPRKGLGHSIVILPFYKIFPYSWERDGEGYRDVCWVAKETTFNAERCKALLGTEYWPSYAITYWSHTWAGDGHDEGNVNKLQQKHDASV